MNLENLVLTVDEIQALALKSSTANIPGDRRILIKVNSERAALFSYPEDQLLVFCHRNLKCETEPIDHSKSNENENS